MADSFLHQDQDQVKMNSDVTSNVRFLSEAVCLTLSQTATQQDRAETYEFLEKFKEKSTHLCIDCGFMMADKQNLDIERHFGLQLLEHIVKFKWHELDIDQKIFVMENTLKLIADGTKDILCEKMFIKDAMTRILVEMIKKEWPQQWPDLLEKLEMLSALGTTQTELVLFVFLRLAEDIVKFQIMPGQRRKDIHQSLNSQMQNIFTFFITILDNKVKCYLQHQNAKQEKEIIIARSNCQVARSVLLTLTGYVEWVNHTILFETSGTLLSMLCLLLNDEHLQIYAADVLQMIVSRKGKIEERKPLLLLFKDDPMSMILDAAVQASSKDLEENHYLFLKNLSQVLIGIGMQLCTIWVMENGVQKPDNFLRYLHAILAITGHWSQTLCSYTYPLWVQFIKHSGISRDDDFQSVLPELIQKTIVSLRKVGYPSQSNSPCCLYSRLDFDSDEEFNNFFCKFRVDVSETVRSITLILPIMASKMAREWLLTLVNKHLDPDFSAGQGYCNSKSPSFIEWDAMTCFLENVQSRLTHNENPYVQDGLQLLKSIVTYITGDPLILSCVLSCMSALLQYITNTPDMLPIIVNKIFAMVTFNLQGQNKSTRVKSVQNVRRHACSIMVKICKNYAPLLLSDFDELCRYVYEISSDSKNVSEMERCTLMEALILISNQFRNYEKQHEFLCRILQPIHAYWLSPEIQQALNSPENFLRYIGLDRPPVYQGSDDHCALNRSSIANVLNTILAVIKRSQWPEEYDEAKSGNFVEYVNGQEFLRNPATDHVMLLMSNIFLLIKVSNELWLPDKQVLCDAQFSGAFDMPEVEKHILFGVQPKCVDNTDSTSIKKPMDRMLIFLQLCNDNAYHILGNAGKALCHGFFSFSELVLMIVNNIFHSLRAVPNYRIRPLIRSFMKPFVQNCPRELYTSVCLPVLTVLAQFMLERLKAKWQMIDRRNTTENGNEDNPESREILEELLIRQLTREYVDLLSDVCIVRKTMNCDITDYITIEHHTTSSERNGFSLSELGTVVLKCDGTCQPVVLGIFGCLALTDTTTCHKAIPLCALVLKHLVIEKTLNSDTAVYLYETILTGLHLHGQHEASQPLLIGLAMDAYNLLRPIFPEIVDVMLRLTSCSPTDLKNFDDKFSQPQYQKSEKKRKEAFRKMVNDVIAKSLAQQFKKEVPIQELPKLFMQNKVKPPPTIRSTTPKPYDLSALFNDDAN